VLRVRLLPFLALLCAFLGGTARASTESDIHDGRQGAAEFREYRVFDLGERFRGHPLTAVLRSQDARSKRPTFSFIYGDCTPEPDSGCAPPYEVQNYAACSRNLFSYGRGETAQRRRSIRGATAYAFWDDRFFDRLEIYTGKTTIVIFAPSLAKARRVARSLQSADGKVARADQLPRPAAGAVEGRLACES
jgi:hypothetical protein